MPEDFLTTDEVAEMKGVTRGAVVHWIHKDDNPLKAEKFQTAWMIKKQDAISYEPSPITGRPKKD